MAGATCAAAVVVVDGSRALGSLVRAARSERCLQVPVKNVSSQRSNGKTNCGRVSSSNPSETSEAKETTNAPATCCDGVSTVTQWIRGVSRK